MHGLTKHDTHKPRLLTPLYCVQKREHTVACKRHNRPLPELTRRPPSCMIVTAMIVTVSPQWYCSKEKSCWCGKGSFCPIMYNMGLQTPQGNILSSWSIVSYLTAFCCIYKHPKVTNDYFKKCVSNICDSLLQSYDDLIIFGDANCCPEKSNTVKDICDVYGLTNLIKTPTCHKGPVSTLIDIILVSNPKRYIGTLNANFGLSDHHNIIGAVTRRFAPSLKPHRIYYRSYKHFCEEKYLHDINCAPFHVADIFDDIDDMAWFHSSLIRTIIDENAPIKSKIVKKKCVPYMNSKLRKAQFARNMSRNKFRRFGKSHWEENRKMRNYVVKIRKMSLKNYFTKHCEKQDKNFWHTVSPFMSDKKYRNGGNITLNENGEIITDASRVSEIFNDFFVNVATDIGFNDDVVSASDAIKRHDQHPSVKRIREYYRDKIKDFDFHVIDTETVMQMIKNINPRKATGCDNIPG